jgi:hypothetical protein
VSSICKAGASGVIGEPQNKFVKPISVSSAYISKKRQNMKEQQKNENGDGQEVFVEWINAPK